MTLGDAVAEIYAGNREGESGGAASYGRHGPTRRLRRGGEDGVACLPTGDSAAFGPGRLRPSRSGRGFIPARAW
jgi:hypothetical protein